MSIDDVKTNSETDDKLDDTTLDQVSGGVRKEALRKEELHKDVLKR